MKKRIHLENVHFLKEAARYVCGGLLGLQHLRQILALHSLLFWATSDSLGRRRPAWRAAFHRRSVGASLVTYTRSLGARPPRPSSRFLFSGCVVQAGRGRAPRRWYWAMKRTHKKFRSANTCGRGLYIIRAT
jgi:hypothetical protein